jgi:3-isopropylmalate/(R)-2-methylmalate dehydratase small subunit
MQPFRVIEERAVPLGGANIDTDQIIPARYLQKPRSTDFGELLFRDVRRTQQAELRPDFALNDPAYAGARILVAGPNFGCGSSREHAVWALADAGFRAVIAPGFGDIFRSNALKNGLLPVALDEDVVEALLEAVRSDPQCPIGIDLVRQLATLPDGSERAFTVDAFARHCLIEGIDELDYTLTQLDRIRDFEARQVQDERAAQAAQAQN